ncbi:hypothetical protein [Streptomyces sp. NPDC087538]|uniref:hypothetical protein n=1 Tax=Streptomyces sp. NPDC087538 TaxID=3365797 RepID=UPI003824F8B7
MVQADGRPADADHAAAPHFEELRGDFHVGVREGVRAPARTGTLVVLVEYVDEEERSLRMAELGFLQQVGRMVDVHRLDVVAAVRRR